MQQGTASRPTPVCKRVIFVSVWWPGYRHLGPGVQAATSKLLFACKSSACTHPSKWRVQKRRTCHIGSTGRGQPGRQQNRHSRQYSVPSSVDTATKESAHVLFTQSCYLCLPVHASHTATAVMHACASSVHLSMANATKFACLSLTLFPCQAVAAALALVLLRASLALAVAFVHGRRATRARPVALAGVA